MSAIVIGKLCLCLNFQGIQAVPIKTVSVNSTLVKPGYVKAAVIIFCPIAMNALNSKTPRVIAIFVKPFYIKAIFIKTGFVIAV